MNGNFVENLAKLCQKADDPELELQTRGQFKGRQGVYSQVSGAHH